MCRSRAAFLVFWVLKRRGNGREVCSVAVNSPPTSGAGFLSVSSFLPRAVPNTASPPSLLSSRSSSFFFRPSETLFSCLNSELLRHFHLNPAPPTASLGSGTIRSEPMFLRGFDRLRSPEIWTILVVLSGGGSGRIFLVRLVGLRTASASSCYFFSFSFGVPCSEDVGWRRCRIFGFLTETLAV